MIVKKNLTIGGKPFIKTYSDAGMLIERDGEQYSEAIDLAELGREYTETDIPIEVDEPVEPVEPVEPMDETEEKAKAYDILMGVSE